MELLAFAFLDRKIGSYSLPFFVAHPVQAHRAAQELAGNPETTIGRHPEDYSLVQLGIFDDNTGRFDSSLGLVDHGTAVSFLPTTGEPVNA